MAEYSSSFPTGDDFSHQTGDGDEPTVAPTSVIEIKSNTGIFIFFQFIAVECGFPGLLLLGSVDPRFKAIFFSHSTGIADAGESSSGVSLCSLVNRLDRAPSYTFLEAMCCGCTPTEMPINSDKIPETSSQHPKIGVGTWDIFRFFVAFCSNVELRETFECFMSWYFELNGYVTFETMTFTEVTSASPGHPEETQGLPTITYDEFMYTCMYWVSFKGDDKMCNLFDEKYEKCKDKSLRREPREIEQPRGAIRARIRYVRVRHQYWVSWSSGWEVASSQGTSKEHWVQEQMLSVTTRFKLICEWEGPWATEEPSTVAP
ncbi:unnamed protein product, partial [Mesorhabditis belari]|uniref:Uncharacterized protein n=1 Tax=Mesorhabditis belari TaxID=2138241 RepID=A0AAF3FRG9_9BILA